MGKVSRRKRSAFARTIHVVWGAPSDAGALKDYRLSWGQGPNGELTSYSVVENTPTGGNAYPAGAATSYTITGLDDGVFNVGLRSRYTDNSSGPWKVVTGISVETPPAQEDTPPAKEETPPGNRPRESTPTPVVPIPTLVEITPEPAGEPEIAEQQAAEPCADPRIESVGGSATNGGALWVWRSVARDPDVDPQGCWYDFRLSYSDDYGATFTEVAVVRGAVGTTDNETYTIDGTTYQRNIERHGAGVPELSIVSALRVSVGCDSEGEDCAHTLDSTDASFDQYYYSRHENKTAGANTKVLLVPANSSEGGNASVTGWLEYDDTETHTYRIAMTKGKTYVFDET